MEFYSSTCDFILRETSTTKTKKRGKKKEEKPLFIYLQVRTTWNDKQIFKSTGVKILPSLWSTRNQRPLFAEFEEHTAGYMELKELAQRLQSAKDQCADITNRLNQAKLTKEEANALLQQLAKLQTAPKQDTTDETIAPHKRLNSNRSTTQTRTRRSKHYFKSLSHTGKQMTTFNTSSKSLSPLQARKRQTATN